MGLRYFDRKLRTRSGKVTGQLWLNDQIPCGHSFDLSRATFVDGTFPLKNDHGSHGVCY